MAFEAAHKSTQALSEHKYKILTVIGIVAGLPLWLQSMLDIVGGDVVVPMGLMIACASIMQIVCAPLYLGLGQLGKWQVPGSDGLIAFSSLAAWALSLFLWADTGAAAGAAFSGYAALLVVGGLGGNLIRDDATAAGRTLKFEDTLNLPTRAHVMRSAGNIEDVSVADILIGNVVLVHAGERAPVDGVVVSGIAEFSSNWLNGNPVPTHRGPGDVVLAGEECFGKTVQIEARRRGSETMLWQSLHGFQEGMDRKPSPAASDSLSRVFLPAGMVVALVSFGFWAALGDVSAAVQNALAVMAVTGPAALGLATGLPLLAAGKALSEIGVKLVDVTAPERAAHLSNLVIGLRDYLILRQPVVESIVTAGATEQEIIADARGLLEAAGHPVAPRLILMAEQEGLEPRTFGNVQHHDGCGISGEIDGIIHMLGNPSLLSDHGVSYQNMNDEAAALEADGKLVLWLAEAGPGAEKRVRGLLALSPGIRRIAADALTQLKAADITTIVYTLPGTVPGVESALAAMAIDNLFRVGGPAALAQNVEELAQPRHQIAVASSSLLDLPAASRADLRIAEVGATGFELMRPAIVVPTGDLPAIASAIVTLRKAGRRNRQNAFLIFSLSAIGMGLAALGLMVPATASGIALGGFLLIFSGALAAGRG